MRLHSLSIPSAKTLSYKILERENWDYGKKKCSPFGKRLLSETAKECTKMSNNNNQLNIPEAREAREAMDRFKMQAAQDKAVVLAEKCRPLSDVQYDLLLQIIERYVAAIHAERRDQDTK